MTQWHPIFDYLLRAVLKDYYEVQTNVPVGDLPREADIVLVRRSNIGKPPFRTLWRNLTRWNILEFKGRSESARVKHIDLLIDVGLGIHRRLQELEPNSKMPRRDVSLWYLANHLGKRFLRDVVELTGELQPIGSGLWRGDVVGRPLWLVSNRDVIVDAESAPVTVVSEQSVQRAIELATVAVKSDEMWQMYAPWLATLFPNHQEEFDAMATKQGRKELDWDMILPDAVKAVSSQKLIDTGTAKTVIDKIGLDGFLALLTPEQRLDLAKRMAKEHR